MVEQRTENPRVGGSIPSLAILLFNELQDLMIIHFACCDRFCDQNQAPRVINNSNSYYYIKVSKWL
jgi:hypothetical protein